MFVRQVQLHDFRSWESLTVDLEPGVTVLLGANGRGKTNVLEALNYLSTLGSHRVSSDQPLIRAGTAGARIAATAVNGGRELSVSLEIVPGKANRGAINRTPVRRTREILGIVQSVLFAPEDLSLVRGDPGDRRRFMDELLTARWPRMAGVRADYEKVLRQRSALLKTAGPSMRRGSSSDGASALATLEVWDGNLARFGAELIATRIDLLSELAPHISAAYADVAPESQHAGISYRSSLGDSMPEPYRDINTHRGPADVELLEAALLAELAQVRDREIARGVCLVGPHRDELELRLGPHPVKGYASHGESWAYALSLRLASLSLLREDGTDPVLMLDDVFAELDRQRRSALAAVAARTEQVLITAAVPEDVPEELRARRLYVEIGDRDGQRVSSMRLEAPEPGADRMTATAEPEGEEP